MSDQDDDIRSLYMRAAGDGKPSSSDMEAQTRMIVKLGTAVTQVFDQNKTINQIREGLGLPPKEDGDRIPDIPEGYEHDARS